MAVEDTPDPRARIQVQGGHTHTVIYSILYANQTIPISADTLICDEEAFGTHAFRIYCKACMREKRNFENGKK